MSVNLTTWGLYFFCLIFNKIGWNLPSARDIPRTRFSINHQQYKDTNNNLHIQTRGYLFYMKTYIISESQVKRILMEEQKIKKGIAFKYSPSKDSEPIYSSKIMEFNSMDDYTMFKESLGDKREIIGEIDID